ncbi:hypothetical protein PVK06_021139 [Gossypium arboreum]|uniref:ATPase AAA-type core domain-containing protein n=1 Tax=Gossypium arboreum TaxID=29729 RepID=A0ABR0PP58_GOSAR|nr:hypothetical protein PVK06_021139 [Gossypium arboreum]
MATETLDDKKPEEEEVIYKENKEGNKEVLDKQMEVEEKENEEEEENEAGVPFYQIAGSEFVEVLVGVGSTRIRDLFKRAKGIFKETTDHLYNAATQEWEITLNQLLIELDGFDTGKAVIFLAATNRRDLSDPTLLRPGRFDLKVDKIYLSTPTKIAILDHERKRTFELQKDGLSDADSTLDLDEQISQLMQCKPLSEQQVLFFFTICLFLKKVHTLAFCSGILDSLAVELKASKDFSKLYASIAILWLHLSLNQPFVV